MNFRIGEKVVYPTHGVGIVEQIHNMPPPAAAAALVGHALETAPQAYLLRIYSSSLRVMVPFINVGSVGLRRVVRRQDVNQVLRYLSAGDCQPAPDWKCRFKENTNKMRSGCLFRVAEVLKCLLLINRAKDLSFRERKMLERARYLLISELAVVSGISEAIAEATLTKALAEAQLKLLPN